MASLSYFAPEMGTFGHKSVFLRRVLRACVSVGREQLMFFIVALAGTLLSIHFGLVPILEKHAAYEVTVFQALFGLLLYVGATTISEARKLYLTTHRQPVPNLDQVRERELLQTVSSWLVNRLADRGLRIDQAFLFGSVIHDHYPTADVDLALVLKSNANRRAPDRLRNTVAVEFKQKFNRRLHLKFCVLDEIEDFLIRAGDHQEIVLSQPSTWLSYFFPRASDTPTHHEN
jgi:hypothetical protein